MHVYLLAWTNGH